jgi:hypothetical protein
MIQGKVLLYSVVLLGLTVNMSLALVCRCIYGGVYVSGYGYFNGFATYSLNPGADTTFFYYALDGSDPDYFFPYRPGLGYAACSNNGSYGVGHPASNFDTVVAGGTGYSCTSFSDIYGGADCDTCCKCCCGGDIPTPANYAPDGICSRPSGD